MRMEIHNPRLLETLKPNFSTLLYGVALTWLLATGPTAASDHPEGGDGRGLFIKLETPWTSFKIGEKLLFRYTLKNASDKPVPIAIPVEEYGLGAMTGGQAFLEPIRTGGLKAENLDYNVRMAPWPPRTALEEEEPQAWTWLPPGQQLNWNQNQLWADHYGVSCYQSFEGFRGHWLAGPNHWISSEPVKVEVVSVPQSEWAEIFQVQWASSGYRGGVQEGTVYRIPIQGKMFLFFDGPFRIAEVEPDDQFEYSIDKEGTNLEITIKGTKGQRKVYFHLAQGYTRDTPWPVGPVSIFDPKPEPIPPAELKVLRAELGEMGRDASRGEDGSGQADLDSPSGSDSNLKNPGDQGSLQLVWVLVASMMVLLVIVVAFKLRKSV